MTFPHKQSSFLDWLQSDMNNFSPFLNQLDQDHKNVTEEVGLLNAKVEERMINIWSDNQDPDIAIKGYSDYASYMGEAYDGDMIYDQLLNELEMTIFPGPGFVKECCKLLGHDIEVASTDAVMQPNAQQSDFSSTIDYSVYVSEIVPDIDQQIQQTSRHEQLPVDKDVPLNKAKRIALEEIQRCIGGDACNGQDNNSEIFGDLQHGLLDDNEEPYMWESDYDGKDLDSWVLYGSDGDMEIFKPLRVRVLKRVPSKESSEEKAQSTAKTHVNNGSILLSPVMFYYD